MIALNVPNIVTIGLIALLVVAGGKMALAALGRDTSWL